jgi:hypothetical protein
MMIEEYKEAILHELEKVNEIDEVEKIINRSIEQFPENYLFRYLVIIYLRILQNGSKKLSQENVDSYRKRNIQYTLNYLSK